MGIFERLLSLWVALAIGVGVGLGLLVPGGFEVVSRLEVARVNLVVAVCTNFVLLVSDGKELNQDTLYHLGVDVGTRDAVIEAHRRAEAAEWPIHKPARTTWRGTPLHELWLKDPGGNLVEIYARLTDAELAEMPADQEPVFLASGG
jgi:hypothetical protein